MRRRGISDAAGRDRAALRARPRGDGARRPRRRDRVGLRVHRLRRRGHLHVGVRDRAPLRLRPAAAARAIPRSSSRARRRYVGEHGTTLDRGAGVRRQAGRVARRRGARQARRRLRPRLRDDRPRLPCARRRRRARAVGRRVRSRARRQEPARARLRPRQRPHQHRGLLDLPRALRAGEDRARDPRAVRAVLRRAGLRPPDDGHGARPARTAARCRSSRSPATTASRRPTWCCRRSRSRAPGGHWVEVSRAICPGKPSEDTKQMLEAYEEYYEAARGALRDGATAHDVHRAVSKGFLDRGFKLGHVTGPLDRDDDDRVPEDRRGRRDGAALRDGVLDAPARDLAGRAGLPLHAGHLARHRGRRRAARRPADEDLRRDGGEDHERSWRNRSSKARAAPTTSATCAPTSCSRCRRPPASGFTATSCSSRPCTRPPSSG